MNTDKDTNIKELFSKPSSVLKLALNDLNACEKDPRYVIDMRSWHRPLNPDVCSVCLAGSVMVKTFNCDFKVNLSPYRVNIDVKIADKIVALNAVRKGYVRVYLQAFDVDVSGLNKYKQRISIPTYSENRKSFKLKLRALQRKLEKEGL